MRFHIGLSFRWKTIKKFLLPFLVGFLAYFGINNLLGGFDFGFIQTYAYTSNTSYFNIDIYDYKTNLKNITCGNSNMYEFINKLIDSVDWATSTNQIFVATRQDYLRTGGLMIYFLPSQYMSGEHSKELWVRGENNTGNQYYPRAFQIMSPVNYNGSFEIYNPSCASDTDLLNSETMTNLINFAQTGANTIFNHYDYRIGVFTSAQGTTAFYYDNVPTNFNNNDSYTFTLWPYYTSYQLVMPPESYVSGSSRYFKPVHIVNNDTTYTWTQNLPTYYNLYPPQPEPFFVGYQTSLDTFYTNLDPSNINSYSLKIKFRVPQSILGYYQTPQEYIDNTTFDFACGGRVDHTNYYSYETFSCSLSSSYTKTENTIEYIFNNLSTSQSLTNYDKIYITINSNYLDSSVSTTMFDFSYTYTLGNFYNTTYKGTIFENFDNLPLDFSMYFSSNNPQSQSKLYVDTSYFTPDIYTIGFSNSTQNESFAVGQSILANPSQYENTLNFKITSVSNSFDTGIMIFQQNGSRSLEHLYLFFNGGMYISNKSGVNEYYFVDNTGQVSTGQFSQPVINNNNDKYDISYYTSYVINFVDSLTDSNFILATYTQDFYNGLPFFFQTFLFVMFILGCIYIIYNLIRK